jgi:hypothetical protein
LQGDAQHQACAGKVQGIDQRRQAETFDLIRKHFGPESNDNAIAILKRADQVMAFLCAESQ